MIIDCQDILNWMRANATLVKHLTSPSIYSAWLGFSILEGNVKGYQTLSTLMLQHLSVNLTEDLGGIDSQLSRTIQTRLANSPSI
jgi:hypothetical protein